MAQKQTNERLETNEREIKDLKEIILGLMKSVERLVEEVTENSASRHKEESGRSNGSMLKMKGKTDGIDLTMGMGHGTTDKSKYKKLEMKL